MAKVFTDTEKDKIKKQAQYILAAMDDIGKNGDAYCTDEHLFRASKAVRPNLSITPTRRSCCRPSFSIGRGIICMPNGRGPTR